MRFLTELVHSKPRTWASDVDRLHALLQAFGPEAVERSFRAALGAGTVSVAFVASCLGQNVLPFDPSREEAG